MSYVKVTPAYVAAAASDLANIGATLTSANSAAWGPTSSVLAPGADEVSASIAALFGAHSQNYQALSAQAALFHQQFVHLMSGGAAHYALTEATNASPLQTAGQTALGSAASAGSTAGGVPAATAGLAGGSAPVAPTVQLATAVSPSPAAPAAVAPTSPPVAAVPSASSAALAPASPPAAAVQPETLTHPPATAAPAPLAPAETPEISPAAAMPATPGMPRAYSPATGAAAGSPKTQRR
jgi:PE family